MGIPRSLYAHVEKRLHARNYSEIAEASLAVVNSRSDATSLKSPTFDRVGGRAGGVSDRTQEGVTRLIEAEERLSRAMRWQVVYAQLDEVFAGTPEGEVAQMLYRDKVTSQQIARLKGWDRQTVRRRRNTYVEYASLLAAEKGLVQMSQYMSKGGEDG